MGKFSFGIDFLDKAIYDIKENVKKGLDFCGLVTEVPQNNSNFAPPVKAASPSDSEEIKTAAKTPEKEPEPACPLGDCCDYDNTLYCTCKKTDTCPKGLKKQYRFKSYGEGVRQTDDLQLFDFLKRYSNVRYNYPIVDKKVYEVISEYLKIFFPNLENVYFVIKDNIYSGFLKIDFYNDKFMAFLREMNEKYTPPKKIYENLDFLYEEYNSRHITDEEFLKVLESPSVLLRDPSLFERDAEDFQYSLRILTAFSSKKKLSEYYYDVTDLSTDMFFDENGKLKPAGIGGPEIGESEDGIWAIIDTMQKEGREIPEEDDDYEE